MPAIAGGQHRRCSPRYLMSQPHFPRLSVLCCTRIVAKFYLIGVFSSLLFSSSNFACSFEAGSLRFTMSLCNQSWDLCPLQFVPKFGLRKPARMRPDSQMTNVQHCPNLFFEHRLYTCDTATLLLSPKLTTIVNSVSLTIAQAKKNSYYANQAIKFRYLDSPPPHSPQNPP